MPLYNDCEAMRPLKICGDAERILDRMNKIKQNGIQKKPSASVFILSKIRSGVQNSFLAAKSVQMVNCEVL